MQNEKHYYLVNGTVKVSDSKMPEYSKSFETNYYNWLSSLQPCEISSIEMDKIEMYLSKNMSTYFDCTAPIDITDIVEDIGCGCGCNESFIKFKQPTEKQVESEYDTEHKLFLESGKEYLLENFDMLSCDVETHQIALLAIRKALKQNKNSIDDQHGAFANMYKKAQNMDIFDFIAMFSGKYKIFKNR